MGKFFSNLFYGLLIGAGIAVALYALGFGVELCNCACSIVTCNCDPQNALPFMWNGDAFKKCILVTTIGGGIIGGIYGAVLGIQERNLRIKERNKMNSEAAAAHRKRNADTLRREVQRVLTSAYVKQKQVNDYALPASYVGTERQKDGWEALKSAYDTNAELQAIVKEISE